MEDSTKYNVVLCKNKDFFRAVRTVSTLKLDNGLYLDLNMFMMSSVSLDLTEQSHNGFPF